MEISVIIPTYKPQTYLWECLDSVCAQTFSKKEFEVILVLNGCNEPYNTQIQEYIAKHQEVTWNYIQMDLGGVCNARNKALDNVKGKYVTFMDDDDYVSPAFLQELYDAADENTISLSYAYAFDDGKPDIQRKYSITDTYDFCVDNGINRLPTTARRYFSSPCMKLIPMSFIHSRRYNPKFRIAEDSIFMFLISDKIDKVTFTSKNAVYYRRFRGDSASYRNRSKRDDIRNCFACICEYTKIFLHGGYSTYFYLSRIAATLYMTMRALKR